MYEQFNLVLSSNIILHFGSDSTNPGLGGLTNLTSSLIPSSSQFIHQKFASACEPFGCFIFLILEYPSSRSWA